MQTYTHGQTVQATSMGQILLGIASTLDLAEMNHPHLNSNKTHVIWLGTPLSHKSDPVYDSGR